MDRLENRLKKAIVPLLGKSRAKQWTKACYISAKGLLDPVFRPRRFRCYGLGMGKSGTHSLSAICEGSYYSAHEPLLEELTSVLLDYAGGKLGKKELKNYIRKRDQHLWLEMEVCTLIVHYFEILLELYPESKFILLARDPFSWINSSWNHLATRPIPDWWRTFDNWRYGDDRFDYHPTEKAVLEPLNLPSTKSHFRLWGKFNDRILNEVPAKQLMVIRLHELKNSTPEVARFLNLKEENLQPGESHQYQASALSPNLIYKIDPDFIESQATQYCGNAFGKIYPEITTIEDSVNAGFLKSVT
ncbi:MAG: sulfotransferase [Puniceicoccaceae bacterium]